MPQTINGIGTTYYGKSKLRQRMGICESCGRGTTLSSYDTRHWFVVVFIPIIPLGKKRIIDQCASCRRHRVMGLGEWESARRKAMEEGMKKVVDNAGDLQARIDLHQTCLLFGEWEKADQLAERIEKEFPDDPRAHLHLASAHAYRGREEEVRKSLERARAIDPTIEEPAPTGGSAARIGAGSGRGRKILWGILAIVVVGGLILADRHAVSHRTLHVVNGYEAPIFVKIEGAGEVGVGPLSHREVELAEGSYRARVTGAAAEEIPFEISSPFLARVFDSRTFVLNPGGAGLLIREETVYHVAGSSSDSDGEGGYTLHYGRNFLTFDRVDFPFREFPREIQMKSADEKRKTRLGQVTESPEGFFDTMMDQNRINEALTLAEWALDVRPSLASLLDSYVDAGADAPRRERILNWLRARTGRRPVNIPLHRAYQQFQRGADPAAMVAEYEAMLRAEPESSALLYLRGRLATGLAESAGWYERAAAADPKNAYAQYALAYAFQSRGRWKEALAANEKACRLNPKNTDFRNQLEEILAGAGEWERLENDLRQRWTSDRWGQTSDVLRLVGVVGLHRDKAAALQVCEEYRRAPRQGPVAPTDRFADLLRCRALYASREFAELEKEAAKGPKDSLKSQLIIALVEQGRLEEAEAAVGPKETDPSAVLARSIAWGLKGDAARAAALREKAVKLLESSPGELASAAEFLDAEEAPALEAVMDLKLAPGPKALVLTALAQAFPRSAAIYREPAERLNATLTYPRHLLSRALAALPKKP